MSKLVKEIKIRWFYNLVSLAVYIHTIIQIMSRFRSFNSHLKKYCDFARIKMIVFQKNTLINMAKITVKESDVTIIKIDDTDYISITDIAKVKNADDANGVIANWLRTRNTIEYLGIWEYLLTLILNPSNSRGLKTKQEQMLLHSLLKNG